MKNPYESFTFQEYLEQEIVTSRVVERLGEGLVGRSAPIVVNCILELAKRGEYGTISNSIMEAIKNNIFNSNSAAFTSSILTTLVTFKKEDPFSVFGDAIVALASIK